MNAIRYARDAGYKVDGHLMPDLPGTTAEKDLQMISEVFLGEDLQLDYCKLYPCLDLPYTVTREWKKTGIWKPIAEHNFPVFLDILRHAMAIVPPWTRVNRVQRDFPEAQERNGYLGFVSETIKSNLQQMVIAELEKHGQACYDIRSREIKNQFPVKFNDRARLFIRCYRASLGTEFFVSVEIPSREPKSQDDAILMGLLRLRFPDYDVQRLLGMHPKTPLNLLPEFKSRILARIRELHVYGNVKMVSKNALLEDSKANSQHTGVGRFLMAVAERVCMLYGFPSLATISGVGVREYYTKLGYHLDTGEGEYMIKDVNHRNLLPLNLFGHSLRDEDIYIPVSDFCICKDFLPVPGFKQSILGQLTTRSNYLKYNYPLIQQGKAELVIIDPNPPSSHFSAPNIKTLCAVVVILFALWLAFMFER